MAYINYGVFPSAESDRLYELVRGHKGTNNDVTPYSILIMDALGATYLAASLLSLSATLLI